MSLMPNHSLLTKRSALLVGMASNHVSGVAYSTATTTIVPPSGMVAGDLVYVSIYNAGSGPATTTVLTTGGQTWSSTKDRASALPEIWTFWCTFNGIWSANPVWDIAANGVAKGAQMFVFRPTQVISGGVWTTDVRSSIASETGLTSTITGITTTQPRTVTIARNIMSSSGITMTSQSSGFTTLGYWSNPSTNNKGVVYFYRAMNVAGPTADLVINLSGSITNYKSMHSFYYI